MVQIKKSTMHEKMYFIVNLPINIDGKRLLLNFIILTYLTGGRWNWSKKNTGLLRCFVYSFTLQFSSLKPLFTLFKYTEANVIKKLRQIKSIY